VWEQVEQFRVPQPAQSLLVPATGRVFPLLLRLTAAKTENTREVCELLQFLQAIGLSAWFMLRSTSNLV